MIKAFLFDYDGVITSGVKNAAPAVRLAKNLNLNIQETSRWMQAVWRPLLKAEITEADVWAYCEAQYGKPIPKQQRDIWLKQHELTPLPEMIQLVQDLKSKDYQVGLLSNVTAKSAALIRQNGGYESFDFLVLSCEVGCAKPEPEIFNEALKHLNGANLGEVIFLDDVGHNTAAASQLGFKTILVRDHSKVSKEINKLISSS